MSVRTATIAGIPPAPSGVEGLEWHPVRDHLGIRAFGVNAYVGHAVGDLVVEDHDESSDEELYVVVRGTARFAVDGGEPFDAPAGSLVLVTPPSRRVAHAAEPETTVIVAGGTPGAAFAVSDWERDRLARGSG